MASLYDPKTTDPALLQRSSEIKSYTTSHAKYDGLRIFYRRHQQADRLPKSPAPIPLLVFIHGLGGSVAQFHPLLTSLTPIASCLAIDLPGCGVSEYSLRSWEPYSTDSLVELLEVIIEDYREKDEDQGVVLIGHSMGTCLAALLANPRVPPRTQISQHVLGLVAICPSSGAPSEKQVSLFRKLLWIPEFLFDLWRAWDRRGGAESASVARFVGADADRETKRLQNLYNNQSRTPNGVAHGGLPTNNIWAGLNIPGDNVTPAKEVDKIAEYLRSGSAESHIVEITAADFERPKKNSDVDEPIDDPSTPNEALTDIPPLPAHPEKTVRSVILPKPATHALLYTPSTARVLAGLVSDFLVNHVTGRLSLGWQLQYLCQDGKWDVKNLEKWQKVAPVSDPIGGIFRAIKTLREVDETHSPKCFVRDWGGIIKDVIDISHDNPVYDPQGLEAGGIHYHKFPTVSKVPPTDSEIKGFIELIDKVREEQKTRAKAEGWKGDYFVGVHCHYGFNRTGFFIVCYLVERCGYTPREAIDHFAQARPKGIKHAHFCDRLNSKSLYGKLIASVPTPQLRSSEQTPLLSSDSQHRPSYDSDRRAEEEDTALHGVDGNNRDDSQRRSSRWRETAIFAWALLATAAVIVLAVIIQHGNATKPGADPVPAAIAGASEKSQHSSKRKRNLVFMVSDGMGPASLSLTRSFRQHVEDLPIDDTLTLDRHFWGTSRTRSSSSLVTDSAAGATAFSCGRKSYNGAISMLPDHTPCGTNDEIALQEVGEGCLGRTVDLMLGGGRCHFLPGSVEGGCRADEIDVTKIAQEKHGWTYADNRAAFDSLALGKNVSLPLLGLFAYYDVPFEIDRRNMADVYPSLSEMAITALTALAEATKDSEKGFFLMIEGSRIDHAGHINDPAAQVREVLEYDKTFKTVLEFLDANDAEGVLVATSDHETGGLATAYQGPSDVLPVYNWHPSILARANASSEHLARLLAKQVSVHPDASISSLKEWINSTLVVPHLGITNARDAELEALANNPAAAIVLFAHMVSTRARIGWSTHGHSAVDVNIYSSGGGGADKLRGNVENTQIGEFLRDYLSVEVEEITQELRKGLGRDFAVGVTVEVEGGEYVSAVQDVHPLEWLHD
ncbi:alkaline phosphatase [Rhypophila sp. PSN 637]